MKHTLPWLISVACLAFAAWMYSRGASPQPQVVPAPSPIQVAQPPAGAPVPDGVVVYTFEDDAGLNGFTVLWQERQAASLRMALLENYWTNEQANLNQLNQQLTGQYNLDPDTNYFLDVNERVLRERVVPPAAEVGTEGGPPAEIKEGEIVQRFEDDASWNAVAVAWQQQQVIGLRRTVLQTYWNQEQLRLNQINERFASDYGIDTARNHFLDTNRRVLLELPTPPQAPAQAQ